jgi:alpha/beta superfamily hydrolase
MDTPLVVELADALGRRGITTLRFNFRGIEGSGGRATGGLIEHEDVRAAAAFLRARGASGIALVGYSFGALMAARAIAAGEDTTAFAAVGFPTSIIGEDAARLADVARALDRAPASLFIHGDSDSFCDAARVASLAAAHEHVTVEELAGRGHFFGPVDAGLVAARVAEFVGGRLDAAG